MSTPTRLGYRTLPIIALLIAILILFWPALLHPSHILHPTFSQFSDTMVIHWPKAHLMARSWQASDGFPHWTPLILSGMPLAANQLAMLSYPPAWLFLWLPLGLTFNLLSIFHLLLGGCGIYFLLRESFRLTPQAALLGGLTFVLNGKWLAHAAGGHASLAGAIGWLPWVVFGMLMLLGPTSPDDRFSKDQTPRSIPGFRPGQLKWVLVVAVGLAMQIVTHTLIFIYSVYLIGAIVGWHFIWFLRANRSRSWQKTKVEAQRLFLPLLSIPILAGLLGAGQLLPLLELVEFSNRSLNLAQASEYSVTVTQLLIGLLLPSAQGGHEFVIYLGLVPLLLVPFGLTKRNHWTWFFGLILIFTILFALGPSTPVHSLFYYAAPGFRWVRTPARIFFVGALATAVLVGFAADRLSTQVSWSLAIQQQLTRLALAIGALAMMLGLGLAVGFGQSGRAALALALFVPAGLGLILIRVRGIASAQLAMILLGGILFLDLASFGMSMMKFLPLETVLLSGRPAAEYLANKPGHFRVYSPSYSLPMQTAAAYDLQLVDGVEPVHLAAYDNYMAEAGGYHDPSFSVTIPNFGDGLLETVLKDVEPDLKLLGLLNAKYLVSAFPMTWPGLTLDTEIEGTYIYVNEYALPRAWVVHQTVPADVDWLTQLAELPDIANTATVEHASQVAQPPVQASTANIRHYSADIIEIETDIANPGWLVVSEIWYPGWQATVNGAELPIEKVNGVLRGILLEKSGQYQITMAYRPRSVIWGNWVTAITAVALVATGLWAGLKS